MSCGEGGSAETIRYLEAAQQAVAEECVRDIKTCNSNQRLFWESGGGAYISLYEPNDPHVVAAVASKLIELTAKVPKSKVVLSVYSSKHNEPNMLLRTVILNEHYDALRTDPQPPFNADGPQACRRLMARCAPGFSNV